METTGDNLRPGTARTDPAVFRLTGRILRRLREIKGLSQNEVALRGSANITYISSIETGHNSISIMKAHMICNAIEAPPHYLLVILARMERSAWLDKQIKKPSESA